MSKSNRKNKLTKAQKAAKHLAKMAKAQAKKTGPTRKETVAKTHRAAQEKALSSFLYKKAPSNKSLSVAQYMKRLIDSGRGDYLAEGCVGIQMQNGVPGCTVNHMHSDENLCFTVAILPNAKGAGFCISTDFFDVDRRGYL